MVASQHMYVQLHTRNRCGEVRVMRGGTLLRHYTWDIYIYKRIHGQLAELICESHESGGKVLRKGKKGVKARQKTRQNW